jgi:hypothetical protein
MLAGLTGPFAVILWPLMLLRLWFHRRSAIPSFAALTVAAMLQVLALTHPHGVPPPPPGLDRAPWARIIGLRLFAQPFLPRSLWPFSADAQFVTGIFGVLVAAVMAFYPGPHRRLRAMLFFAAVLVQSAVCFRMHSTRDILLLGPDMAPRYFFDARILLAWLVLTVARAGFPSGLRAAAVVCAAAYFVTAALSFRIPPLPNLGWPRYAPMVREGRPIDIPINPVPWIYQYPGRAKR